MIRMIEGEFQNLLREREKEKEMDKEKNESMWKVWADNPH